ncbi:MAG: SDR family oxidoreductase [Phycisphaerales bacterium]
MADRVALVTGANKGIGLETSRQLGKLGIMVLMGARDEAAGRRAAESLSKEGVRVKTIRLDVSDAGTIEAAAAAIRREHGRLDILVNNAGVAMQGQDGPPTKVTMTALRQTFEINFFGLIAVTQAMLPLLRESAAGRIVNLTSILGSAAEHADPNSPIHGYGMVAYNTSKAAVNLYTIQLALELKGTKIKVNAAHPGWVKTDMGGPGAQLELADGAKTGVALATLPDDGPTGGYYHMGVHMRW